MKIIQEDQIQLVATDKAMGALVVSIILGLAGIGIALSGLLAHAMVPELSGGVLVLVGVGGVLLHKARTLVVDKSSGQVTVTVKSVIQSGTYPYALGDVQKVQLVSSYQTMRTGGARMNNQPGLSFGSGGNTQTTQQTHLLLVMKDGTTIDLADAQRSMQTFGIFGSVPGQGVGEKIAAYIGVPFESVGPPSLGQMVGTIQSTMSGNMAPSVVPSEPTAPAATPTAPTEPSEQ